MNDGRAGVADRIAESKITNADSPRLTEALRCWSKGE
jgi:hypothetical protein